MPMVMFMKAIGKMIRLMDVEYILMLMEAAMKVNGSKISNTASVLKDGLMAPHTRDSTFRERNMARENSHGPIIALTLVTSMITIFMELAFMSGLTEEYSQANGGITRWRATEPSLGQTVVAMLETMLMT